MTQPATEMARPMAPGLAAVPAPIPTAVEFTVPLLRYLHDHLDGGKMVDICDAVADVVGLTPKDREQMLPSGGDLVFRNRIAWAQWYLKTAGLSQSTRPGWWQITASGRESLGLSCADIKRMSDAAKPKNRGPSPKRQHRDAIDAEILRLHEQGLAPSEISRRLNLAGSTVRDARVRLGVGAPPTPSISLTENIRHAVSASSAALSIRFETITAQLETTDTVADEKETKQWITELHMLTKTAKALRDALRQKLQKP